VAPFMDQNSTEICNDIANSPSIGVRATAAIQSQSIPR
jgi:hypothetical protein